MSSNEIQHEKMYGFLEKITWIIEVVQGEETIWTQSGFAVKDNLIMSSAYFYTYLKKGKVKFRARKPNNGWVYLDSILLKKSWDIVIFQFRSDAKYKAGKFVSDGTLSEKQTLLHMGLRSYHIARACSLCVENVKYLPSWDNEGTCEKFKPPASETMPVYPVMGHVWNSEVYKKFRENNSADVAFIGKIFNPLVPIIQLYGFDCYFEDLGGPIINTLGEIVGMFAGNGKVCIGIHVTALKVALNVALKKIHKGGKS